MNHLSEELLVFLRAPSYPLLYPKYPKLRTIRPPVQGLWGVLVYVFRVQVAL